MNDAVAQARTQMGVTHATVAVYVRGTAVHRRSASMELGGLVCLGRAGHLRVLPFDAFRDPETERTKVRLVDIESEGYRVARDYMLRLEQADLEDPDTLAALSAVSGIPEPDVRERFSMAVRLQPQGSPPP